MILGLPRLWWWSFNNFELEDDSKEVPGRLPGTFLFLWKNTQDGMGLASWEIGLLNTG